MPKKSRARTYVRSRAMKPDPRHLAAMVFAAFMFLWIMTTLALAEPVIKFVTQTVEISANFLDGAAYGGSTIDAIGETLR